MDCFVQMVIDDILASCHPSEAHSSDTMDMQFLPDMLSGPPQQPDYMQPAGMQGGDPHGSPLFMMHQQALQAARQAGYARAMQQQQQQQQQPQQQLPSWCRAPDQPPHSMDLGMEDFPNMYFPAAPEQQQQQQQHQRQQRGLLSVPQPPQALQGLPDAIKAADAKVPEVKQEPISSQPSEVLSQAQDLLAFNHSQPKYIPEEHFTRMSAKLFNCTPEHLPPDLKQNLIGLLSCGVDSIEGYIMPGCLQLTIDASVSREQLEIMQGMSGREAVKQLLQGQNKAFWGSDAMLVSELA